MRTYKAKINYSLACLTVIAGSYCLSPHFFQPKPDLLMKRVVDLPDGVVFKVLEYMYGTAGARVPEITPPTHVTTPSEEPDEVLRKAIRALSETLRISDREAVELLLSSQQT